MYIYAQYMYYYISFIFLEFGGYWHIPLNSYYILVSRPQTYNETVEDR